MSSGALMMSARIEATELPSDTGGGVRERAREPCEGDAEVCEKKIATSSACAPPNFSLGLRAALPRGGMFGA